MPKPPARVALECLCLLCAPAALAALSFHWLIPSRANEASPSSVFLARANEQPVAAFLIFFLLFSFLGRQVLALLQRRGILARIDGTSAAAASKPQSALRFFLSVTVAATSTLLVRAIVCQPYRVLSASMLPTLQPGAWIFANKLSYGLRIPGMRKTWFSRAPERGDVIALETPTDVADAAPQLVKRVIGLPGDRISMRGGRPVINGWAVPVCDAGLYSWGEGDAQTRGRMLVEFLGKSAYLTVYVPERARFTGYTVQPGEVFVLGDNRNNSSDSRAWAGGRGAGLSLAQIDGRIVRVLFDLGQSGKLDPASILESLGERVRRSGAESDELAAGIARCMRTPPSDTTPPPPPSSP